MKPVTITLFLFLLFISFFIVSAKYKTVSDKDKVMSVLDTYVGEWKSDMKTDQNGDKIYFIYHLSYFDESKSIVKMVIKRHYQDNRTFELLWEGFKGWNPVTDEAYYYGFSPSGRFSIGRVYVDDDKLITEYTGYGTDGNPVQITDEFFPVQNSMFHSVTHLKPDDGDWRVIARDEWTKL